MKLKSFSIVFILLLMFSGVAFAQTKPAEQPEKPTEVKPPPKPEAKPAPNSKEPVNVTVQEDFVTKDELKGFKEETLCSIENRIDDFKHYATIMFRVISFVIPIIIAFIGWRLFARAKETIKEIKEEAKESKEDANKIHANLHDLVKSTQKLEIEARKQIDKAREEVKKIVDSRKEIEDTSKKAENLYKNMLETNESYHRFRNAEDDKSESSEERPLNKTTPAKYPDTAVRAIVNEGLSYFYDNQSEKAIEVFEKGLKTYSDNPDLLFYLGFVLQNLNKLDIAQEKYEKVLKLEPDMPEANMNLGVILAHNASNEKDEEKKLEIMKKAEVKYNKAIENITNKTLAYHNLGCLYEDMNKYDDAIEAYENALKINSKSFGTFINLLNVLGKNKKHNEIYEKLKERSDDIALKERLLKDPTFMEYLKEDHGKENAEVKHQIKLLFGSLQKLSMVRYLMKILNELWNKGNPKTMTLQKIREVLGESAYANHRSLSLPPWDLVEGDKERKLSERGISFVKGELEIPYRIIKYSFSDEWEAEPGTENIKWDDRDVDTSSDSDE